LRPLRVNTRTTVRWFIWHCSACLRLKNEVSPNGAPYQSISVDFLLLDSLFRKKYRYDFIISPFSRGEKQQASSRPFRFPILLRRREPNGAILMVARHKESRRISSCSEKRREENTQCE
jgi:hypothetical protein